MNQVPKSAKIVIIGGGVVGLFTARELCVRGETDIVILERRSFLGAGSTQKAAGGFRTQFTTPANVAFSKYSKNFYLNEFPKLNPHFEIVQHGYLLFARDPNKLASLDHSYELQVQAGVENVHRVDAEFIKSIIPELDVSEILGGNYTPEDGWLDPGDVVRGLDDAVRRYGIPIFLDTEVSDVIPESDYSHKVITSAGEIHAKHVLFATGAWSRQIITDKLGIEIHMHPYRHTLWITAPLPWYPKNSPFTFDVLTSAHFRPESGGLMLGHDNHGEVSSLLEIPDMDFFFEIIPNFLEIMPKLEEAEIANSWGGLYETSKDHSAIIGALPTKKGLWMATGFSGHGVMHAPATGISMAELILDGKTSTLDIHPYRLSRFDEGDLIHETAVF